MSRITHTFCGLVITDLVWQLIEQSRRKGHMPTHVHVASEFDGKGCANWAGLSGYWCIELTCNGLRSS